MVEFHLWDGYENYFILSVSLRELSLKLYMFTLALL